jgi:mRNA deadenylase 3'-5' endonuclease subunit Ccr4
MNRQTGIQKTGYFDFKEFRCEKFSSTGFTTLEIKEKKEKVTIFTSFSSYLLFLINQCVTSKIRKNNDGCSVFFVVPF